MTFTSLLSITDYFGTGVLASIMMNYPTENMIALSVAASTPIIRNFWFSN